MTHVNFQSFRKPFTAPPELGQNGSDPFISEKKLFGLWGSWYSNRPARTHDFNAKISFKKMHRDLRYHPKCVNFCWFGLVERFWALFWNVFLESIDIFLIAYTGKIQPKLPIFSCGKYPPPSISLKILRFLCRSFHCFSLSQIYKCVECIQAIMNNNFTLSEYEKVSMYIKFAISESFDTSQQC